MPTFYYFILLFLCLVLLFELKTNLKSYFSSAIYALRGSSTQHVSVDNTFNYYSKRLFPNSESFVSIKQSAPVIKNDTSTTFTSKLYARQTTSILSLNPALKKAIEAGELWYNVKVAILGSGIRKDSRIQSKNPNKFQSIGSTKCQLFVYDCVHLTPHMGSKATEPTCLPHFEENLEPQDGSNTGTDLAKTIYLYPNDDRGIAFFDFRISDADLKSIPRALEAAIKNDVDIIYLPPDEKYASTIAETFAVFEKEKKQFVKKDGGDILISGSIGSQKDVQLFSLNALGRIPNIFIVGSMATSATYFRALIRLENSKELYIATYLSKKVLITEKLQWVPANLYTDSWNIIGTPEHTTFVFFFCDTKDTCQDYIKVCKNKENLAAVLVSKTELKFGDTFLNFDIPVLSLILSSEKSESLQSVLKSRITHVAVLTSHVKEKEKEVFEYPSLFSAIGPGPRLEIKPDILVSSLPLLEFIGEAGENLYENLKDRRLVSNARFVGILASYVQFCKNRKKRVKFDDVLKIIQSNAKPFLFSTDTSTHIELQRLALNNDYLAAPVPMQGSGSITNFEHLRKNFELTIKLSTSKFELGRLKSEISKEVTLENTGTSTCHINIIHKPAFGLRQENPQRGDVEFLKEYYDVKVKTRWGNYNLLRRHEVEQRLQEQAGHTRIPKSNIFKIKSKEKLVLFFLFTAPQYSQTTHKFYSGYIQFLVNCASSSESNEFDLHIPYTGASKDFTASEYPYLRNDLLEKSSNHLKVWQYQGRQLDEQDESRVDTYVARGDVKDAIAFDISTKTLTFSFLLNVPVEKLEVFFVRSGKVFDFLRLRQAWQQCFPNNQCNANKLLKCSPKCRNLWKKKANEIRHLSSHNIGEYSNLVIGKYSYPEFTIASDSETGKDVCHWGGFGINDRKVIQSKLQGVMDRLKKDRELERSIKPVFFYQICVRAKFYDTVDTVNTPTLIKKVKDLFSKKPPKVYCSEPFLLGYVDKNELREKNKSFLGRICNCFGDCDLEQLKPKKKEKETFKEKLVNLF